MAITRKTLIIGAATVAALFAIADPLGDSHHGIGKHHHTAAVLGNVFFGAFLIGVVVVVVLVVVALLQHVLHSRRTGASPAPQ